jgi:hypothetical protein
LRFALYSENQLFQTIEKVHGKSDLHKNVTTHTFVVDYVHDRITNLNKAKDKSASKTRKANEIFE